MKLHVYIGVVLMAMMVGCKSPTTSPLPSSVGEREVYQTLVGIDSLMWRQPDNALAVMMEFAGSSKADSMDVFEEHYCQMLVAELLFKNNYDQTNREALQQAVAYFDSLVRLAPPLKGGRGDSKHTFS